MYLLKGILKCFLFPFFQRAQGKEILDWASKFGPCELGHLEKITFLYSMLVCQTASLPAGMDRAARSASQKHIAAYHTHFGSLQEPQKLGAPNHLNKSK